MYRYTEETPPMTIRTYEKLLQDARAVLERYQFDGEVLRDDVAEICMKIDDTLSRAPAPEAAAAPMMFAEQAA
jgi:hypothetical protein